MPSSSTKMKSGSLSFFPFSSHPLLVIPLLSVLFYFSFSFTRRRFSRSRWSRSEIVADAKTSSVRYVCVCASRPAAESTRQFDSVALPPVFASLCFVRFWASLKRRFPPRREGGHKAKCTRLVPFKGGRGFRDNQMDGETIYYREPERGLSNFAGRRESATFLLVLPSPSSSLQN